MLVSASCGASSDLAGAFNAGKPTSADRRNRGLNDSTQAIQSSKWSSCLDQQRVLTGVSFRATENSPLPRIHKAAAQFTSPESHCRHWRRKILVQVRSVTGHPPIPAMLQSNCIRLGAGHPPFVFASKRPLSGHSARSSERALATRNRLCGLRIAVELKNPFAQQWRNSPRRSRPSPCTYGASLRALCAAWRHQGQLGQCREGQPWRARALTEECPTRLPIW